MQRIVVRLPVALGAIVGALALAAPADAQSVTGHATAVRATVPTLLGPATTALAATGPLAQAGDARGASTPSGEIASILSAGTLHAAAVAGDSRVASEASAADVAMHVAGTAIGASFVMARAAAPAGAPGSGSALVEGLSINGLAIPVTGAANQTIDIPGGRVVINEQRVQAGQAVVNALHIVVDGVADLIVASAAAGIE